MTPVFLALTGRGMGMRLGSAFRCGLRVTGALFGLNLMVNSLGSSLSGLTSDIAAAHNLAMDVTDVGWGASSAIASASTIASWMIPLYLAVNWVMFLTRSTRTVNLDLWNLWHVTFMGAMVERLTDSLAYGMVATAALSVVLMVFSDRCGWRLARQCQLTGVSIAGGFGTAAMVVCANYVTSEVNKNAGTEVNWGLFNYPAVDGGVDNTSAYAGANSLAVTEYSENAQAAFDFIIFLTTGEWDQKMANEAGQIPADSRNTAPASQAGTIETLLAAEKPMTWCAGIHENDGLKDTIKSMCIELFEGKYADGAAFCAALDALY